jgi:uncharacterized protein YndB with AHSA1/START domain
LSKQPAAIEVSRLFDAPRERVFAAWSSGERLARWFSPEGCSVPHAEIDFRAGGVFALTMRMPDGEEHSCHGAFEEVTPPSRLVFTLEVEMKGAPRFRARTIVDFAAEGERTLMTVRQSYDLYDEAFAGAPAGAREGWRTTLDKLARELARAAAPAAHGAFTIKRDFPHPAAKVYRAFAELEAKTRWFTGGEDWTPVERRMDVRPGGREFVKGRWKNGTTTTFDAVYLDVVPSERLVYAYNLFHDAEKLSVSLATLEIAATDGGCRLSLTEQGAFLNGYEDGGSRERGTREMLERVARTL